MNELEDVLHIYLSNFYQSLRKKRKFFVVSWFYAINYIIKNVVYALIYRNKQILKREEVQHKVWLLCSSINNYNTLKFLTDEIKETIFITTNTFGLQSDLKDMNRISFHYNLVNLLKIPYYLFLLVRKRGFFCIKVVDFIFESVGMVDTCEQLLSKEQPSTIIFSNDHTVKNRALLIAAKKLSIPTIYIQHASITLNFPTLKFDLNLLEGQDTLDKYKAIGDIEGEVCLVGMPKFDGYENQRRNAKSIKRIGICSKIIDNEKDIFSLINAIESEYSDYVITYRPHPRDKRNLIFKSSVLISDSKSELIFDFLKNQDLVIAGDTSLHLEATMLNVHSLYYNITINEGFIDAYGYVKNGLVEEAKDIPAIKDYILKNKNVEKELWKKAAYYNATINTDNEGNSQQLAIKKIKNFLSDKC